MTALSPLVLTPFVKGVQEFQKLGLVNKAVLDATAVDIPLITLAKNPTERKERFVRQALVLGIAFLFAPLHARAVSGLFAKGLSIPVEQHLKPLLMQVPYKKLVNPQTLAEGIQSVFAQHQKALPIGLPSKLTQTHVGELIKSKTNFLMTDLALCGFLLASVGHIKVLFGKLISGKKQFTGEQDIVADKTLDQLYEKEKQAGGLSSKQKYLLSAGLGILAPMAIALLTRHNLLKNLNQTGKSWFRDVIAPKLDYNYGHFFKGLKKWPLLSDGSQIVLALLLTAGELFSARSKRERTELAIQRNAIDGLFFLGTPLFMKLLSGATTVDGAIAKTLEKGKLATQAAAKRSAWAYVASYLLASASVAGIVAYTNQLTKKAVQHDAAQLENKPAGPTAPSSLNATLRPDAMLGQSGVWYPAGQTTPVYHAGPSPWPNPIQP